jgi:catechol 2,3-dioxygenase-like lactoylglutathione lyase family enzyme
MTGDNLPYSVTRAGHIVIRVRDPEATAAFFKDVAGFNQKGVVQQGMHFLTSDFDENHHMLLVRPAKPGATTQDRHAAIGMARVSFEMRDAARFDVAIAKLREKGIEMELDTGGGRRSVRFNDFDGLPFEFWCRAAAGAAA